MRIRCLPVTPIRAIPSIDIEWDEEAGCIEGEGADYLEEMIRCGQIPLHPHPSGLHQLSESPLKSRRDMAVIVGYRHRLPKLLRKYYPHHGKADANSPKVEVLDEDGQTIQSCDLRF